jgi:hypothetical protein
MSLISSPCFAADLQTILLPCGGHIPGTAAAAASGATSAADDPSLYYTHNYNFDYQVEIQHRSLINLITYTTQSSQYNMSAKDVS